LIGEIKEILQITGIQNIDIRSLSSSIHSIEKIIKEDIIPKLVIKLNLYHMSRAISKTILACPGQR